MDEEEDKDPGKRNQDRKDENRNHQVWNQQRQFHSRHAPTEKETQN